MSAIDFYKLKLELSSVSVFRNVVNSDVMTSFRNFLESESLSYKLSFYAEFVNSLAYYNGCFSAFLKKALGEDENSYITRVASKKEIPGCIAFNMSKELEIFTLLSSITVEDICKYLDYDGYIPEFENSETDFSAFYEEKCKNVFESGYGIFSSHPMFRLVDGEIAPVEAYDEISINDFVGYEKERQIIIDNTMALIDGKSAANVLLYGDAGTGKSSSVKAVTNLLFDKGIRLIEIRKDQLLYLSDVMAKIAKNPLKFIIFIDDLSFNKNDDQFSMLKAALEGSASAKSNNSVIYATSNRRHIVKESFQERSSGDDIHRNDTIQELLSLSERFGLTVYFSKPDKKLYLDIVHQLAERYGTDIDEETLDIKAEAFALNKGIRSPRAAEQFVKSLIK